MMQMTEEIEFVMYRQARVKTFWCPRGAFKSLKEGLDGPVSL